MKGFGLKRYNTQLFIGPYLQTGKSIGVCMVNDVPCVEVESAARIAEKQSSRLMEWAASNDVTLYQCQWQGTHYQAIDSHSFIEYLTWEITESDNAYADQALSDMAKYALLIEGQNAVAEGRDYITLPGGHKVRMSEDGTAFCLEDIAAAIGVSPEEMEATLNSPDFQRFLDSRW